MDTASPPVSDYLKPADVAARLNIGVRTVQDLITRGELKALRIGRVWRIHEDALKAYLEHAQTDCEP